MIAIALATILSLGAQDAAPPKEPLSQRIQFPSGDGLMITAELYRVNQDTSTPFLVLFHQAKSSRAEYREIAPRLNELGYNCLAVDLRSGGKSLGVKNGTARAHGRAHGKDATYLESLPDMLAALEHARSEYAEGKLVAWGSSYSAALSLYLAGTEPDLADGVIAFSPGEYFERFEKPADWIERSCATIRVPAFITSARSEKDEWAAMLATIPGDDKVGFLPAEAGQHGSRALWKKTAASERYWEALLAFLEKYFPVEQP